MNKTLIIIAFLNIQSLYSQNIVIERQFSSEGCIIGTLKINDQFIGYTLELPRRDDFSFVDNPTGWTNKEKKLNIALRSKLASSIPAGIYSAKIRFDDNYSEKWRIELLNVTTKSLAGQITRTAVQIHLGNFSIQTNGCILVGSNANLESCSVSNSGLAIKKMQEAVEFYSISESSQPIVTITDPVTSESNTDSEYNPARTEGNAYMGVYDLGYGILELFELTSNGSIRRCVKGSQTSEIYEKIGLHKYQLAGDMVIIELKPEGLHMYDGRFYNRLYSSDMKAKNQNIDFSCSK